MELTQGHMLSAALSWIPLKPDHPCAREPAGVGGLSESRAAVPKRGPLPHPVSACASHLGSSLRLPPASPDSHVPGPAALNPQATWMRERGKPHLRLRRGAGAGGESAHSSKPGPSVEADAREAPLREAEPACARQAALDSEHRPSNGRVSALPGKT